MTCNTGHITNSARRLSELESHFFPTVATVTSHVVQDLLTLSLLSLRRLEDTNGLRCVRSFDMCSLRAPFTTNGDGGGLASLVHVGAVLGRCQDNYSNPLNSDEELAYDDR